MVARRAHIRRTADVGSSPQLEKLTYCGVEQMVARRAHNPKAVGSSPTPATKKDPGDLAGVLPFFDMSHWVYGLYSIAHDKLYVGESADPVDRFRSHNELATKGWTVAYRPWVVIYLEECEDRIVALRREKQLKSGAGREYLRTLIPQVLDALSSTNDVWKSCVHKSSPARQ